MYFARFGGLSVDVFFTFCTLAVPIGMTLAGAGEGEGSRGETRSATCGGLLLSSRVAGSCGGSPAGVCAGET